MSRRSKATHVPRSRRRLKVRVERARDQAEVDRLDKEQRTEKQAPS